MSCLFLRQQPVAEGARVIYRQDPLAQRDSVILERYRFSREGVIYIIHLLELHIKCSTWRSRALTTSGTFLYTIGDAENLVKSAVCRAIHFLWHFQVPPGPNEGDFVNRKGFHSVNVQMVCDSMHLITNVEAKWPGSVHDSRIFRESHLFTLFERGDFDGILLGDGGCACRQYFMTPSPNPNPTPGAQTRYNASLARTRACIEMTFGQLKQRFQCLKSLRVASDRACDIIVACVILHNIATIRKERIPVVEVQPDDDDLQPVHLDQPSDNTHMLSSCSFI
uniref:DDE Tnp4 domain-containing protein n=1 Tax=Fundulus heteroclitus TaxID=8078 RepID=A0A3Q2PB11_FUNHE